MSSSVTTSACLSFVVSVPIGSAVSRATPVRLYGMRSDCLSRPVTVPAASFRSRTNPGTPL
jgi:hypothetical protein